MKKSILTISILSMLVCLNAQTKNFRNSFSIGGSINQYNGNLGSSFYDFNATCFAGVNATFGNYINRSFDFNLNATVGHFGYCQRQRDRIRFEEMELGCPGCTDGLGMAELRSLMVGANVSIKYKFANGYILKENSKLAPFVSAGLGLAHLSDNMKKQCVTVGMHYTLNAGAGLRYNVTDRFHVQYTANFGYFVSKKVYADLTGTTSHDESAQVNSPDHHSEEMKSLERKHDMILQNTLSFGINF
ncbi:MAG TPA: hypothetical protein VGF79_05365 [Bacteroidia bacterium]